MPTQPNPDIEIENKNVKSFLSKIFLFWENNSSIIYRSIIGMKQSHKNMANRLLRKDQQHCRLKGSKLKSET